MKTYLKIAFALLVGGTLFYSCTKTDNKPSSALVNNKPANIDVVSGQVAVTLTRSLAGSFGGVNLNKSLKPSNLVLSYPSQTYSLCGFVADSVLNYYTNDADTVKSHTTGTAKFIFECQNGQPDGYSAYDTTKTVGTAPTYSFVYDIDQYYRIYVCGCGLLHVNGTQKAFITLTFNNTSLGKAVAQNNYTLSNLTVDLNNDSDVTSGSATFTSTGTNSYGTWNLSGTITYLGNHTAQVVVGNNTVTVDIRTGKTV
jgi:hypothetical protein